MTRRFLTIAVLCIVTLGIGVAYISKDDTRLNDIETYAGTAMPGAEDIGGHFTLTDHNGNVVSSTDFGDQYKLIFFGFTYCPDVCPIGLQKITQAMEMMDADMAAMIQPAFITIDPARDTPEIMQAYVSQYHDKMIGFTGTQEEIDAVVKQYRVYVARMDHDEVSPPHDNNHDNNHENNQGDDHGGDHGHHDHGYSMDHSAYTFLMSPDDKLITVFAGSENAQDMAAEIRQILNRS